MKKTLKKRAFISAIAMLIVSAIVLTSSTFAWFAMATQVSVDTMDLTITSLDGIVFSANTTNWTTKLSTTDITNTQSSTYRYGAYEGNKNNIPTELAPVSTLFSVSNEFPTFYSGSIDNNGLCTVSKATSGGNCADDVGRKFVAFDLFIKLATATTVTWNSTLSVNEGDLKDAMYAMRVGIVYCGTVTEKAKSDEILPKRGAGNAVATVWEMDTTKHGATSGVEDGTELITQPMAAATQLNLGTGHVVTKEDVIKSGVFCNFATRDTAKTIAAPKGVTKLRVYIWLEGQDVDCDSAIAGSIVKCGLSFSING